MLAQRQALLDKYIHAYRVVDARDPRLGWLKSTAAERRADIAARVSDGRMIPLKVEDVATPYYIRAEDEDLLLHMEREEPHYDPSGPVRFLPPLDNLLWRRERIVIYLIFIINGRFIRRGEKNLRLLCHAYSSR